MALTGNDKTARKQFRACGLFYFVGFARQKRLVDLYPAVDDRRIRTYLITRTQQNNIVPNKFFGSHAFQGAVAKHLGMGRIQQIHFVKRLFRTNSLNDSDKRVSDDNRQKSQVSIRPDDNQKHRDYQKYQVEIGEHIRADYLFC